MLYGGILGRKSLFFFFFLTFLSHSLSPKSKNVPSFCSRYPNKLQNSLSLSFSCVIILNTQLKEAATVNHILGLRLETLYWKCGFAQSVSFPMYLFQKS